MTKTKKMKTTIAKMTMIQVKAIKKTVANMTMMKTTGTKTAMTKCIVAVPVSRMFNRPGVAGHVLPAMCL